MFGIFISSGVVEFGPEVTGKDQKTKMLLNDQDKVENGNFTETTVFVAVYLGQFLNVVTYTEQV